MAPGIAFASKFDARSLVYTVRGGTRLFSGDRIAPPKAPEAGKVGIGGSQNGVVFHSQRRQVRVGDEVTCSVASSQHLLEQTPMLLGWCENTDAGLLEPALDALDALSQGKRPFV